MASISGPDPGRAGVQDRYLENDCLRNGERNPFRQHQGMALSGEDVERFPRRYPARSMTVARHSDTRSEEHTSELQSLMRISYAVFCLKKKRAPQTNTTQRL